MMDIVQGQKKPISLTQSLPKLINRTQTGGAGSFEITASTSDTGADLVLQADRFIKLTEI